jgi:hypothetical protein
MALSKRQAVRLLTLVRLLPDDFKRVILNYSVAASANIQGTLPLAFDRLNFIAVAITWEKTVGVWRVSTLTHPSVVILWLVSDELLFGHFYHHIRFLSCVLVLDKGGI